MNRDGTYGTYAEIMEDERKYQQFMSTKEVQNVRRIKKEEYAKMRNPIRVKL